MRIELVRKGFADVLSHVERIIPARSSNPALSLLKLTLCETGLTLHGSDMNIDIEATVPTSSDASGTFALPAQLLTQIVRSLPGEHVELTFGGSELAIVSGNYATKLQLVDPSQVPPVSFPDAYAGALAASDLVRALSHVRYATAVADYQAIFRGVKLELADSYTRAVATDGFRLAYYHLPVASGLEAQVVIPARSVDELMKLFADGEVALAIDQGRLSLNDGRFRVNVKLMEGSFPDYNRVIPSHFPVSITADAAALAQAISRVAVMADKTANNRIDMFVREGTLQITAEGGYGRAQEALAVAHEGSDPEIALAYNAKYLVDALSPISGKLQLRFSGVASPSVLVSLEDPNYLAMVVPLRTS